MVPLLKRHFLFSWHGFATENVNTRGTKSQSGGQCIYKMSHIFIRLSGSRGSKRLSSGFPPSPLRKVTSWSSSLGFLFPLDFPKGLAVGPWGVCLVPEHHLSMEVLHELSQLTIPKVCLQLTWGPPPGCRLLGDKGIVEVPPPYLGLEVGCLKVPHSLPPYRPSHGWQREETS